MRALVSKETVVLRQWEVETIILFGFSTLLIEPCSFETRTTIVVKNVRKVLNFYLRGDFPPLPCFNVEFLTVNLYALFIAGEANIEWGEGEYKQRCKHV